MKKNVVMLLCGLFVTFDILAFTNAEWATAINTSGRQRMLSQKMAKEFALVALGHKADENKKNLTATIKLFQDSHASLVAKAPNDKIKSQLSKVEGLWKSYKPVLEKMNKADMAKVYDLSLNVLKEMNKGVKAYETAAAKAGIKGKGKIINVAGRQRMLSQKMSKEAFFIALGHNAAKLKGTLKKTISLFDVSLTALMNGDERMRIPAATSGVKGQLQTVKGLWTSFKPHVDGVAGGKDANASIAPIAEQNVPLLKEMNKAVGMFE